MSTESVKQQQPTPGEWRGQIEIGSWHMGMKGEPSSTGYAHNIVKGGISYTVAFSSLPDGSPPPTLHPDAELIVAACNAAKEANPDNPIAAARALPELLEALRAIKYMVSADIEPNQLNGRLWAIEDEADVAIASATKGKEQ